MGLREERREGPGLLSRWADRRPVKDANPTGTDHANCMVCDYNIELFHKWVKQPLGFAEVATQGFDAVRSHAHWVYCAYILLHLSPPGLSPGAQSIGDKQRALQQGLADTVKRHILQQLTHIGGVQRYKDAL